MTSDISSLSLSPQLLAQITNFVQEDLASSATLIGFMEKEREALIKRNTTELSDIVENKNDLLDAIENNSQRRHTLLSSLNIEANESNWQELIAHINNEELNKSTELLIANLQQCQHLNNVNGKMVARGKQTLNRLQNILRGQIELPNLYTNSGATDSQNTSHAVVKA